jgi:hypothetical protein
MRKIVLLLVISAYAPSAFAEDYCGREDISQGGTTVSAILTKSEDKWVPPVYLPLTATSQSEKFTFSVSYQTGNKSYRPKNFSIRSEYFAVDEKVVRLKQKIRWRLNGGKWSDGSTQAYPDKVSSNPSVANVYVRVAQWVEGSPGLTFRPEELDRLKTGGRYEIQRLSAAGEVLAADVLDYPTGGDVDTMFGRAATRALLSMKPCKMNYISPAR